MDVLYQLVNGRWVNPATPYPADHETTQIAVDNSGNGWLLAGAILETGSSTLVRLSKGAKPQAVALPVIPPKGNTSAPLHLHALSLDEAGRGWVVGGYALGRREDLPNIETLYGPVALRLRGGEVSFVSGESINIRRGRT